MTIQELTGAQVGLPRFQFEVDPKGTPFGLSSHRRAEEALSLGLSLTRPPYNIYVVGPDEAGRMTATRGYLEAWAATQPPGQDWLYLTSFDSPHSPRPLALPAGTGRGLRDAVNDLIPALARELAAAFAGERYQQQHQALRARGDAEVQSRTRELESQAREQGLSLVSTPQGPMLAALDAAGEPQPLETVAADQQSKLVAASETIMQALGEIQRDAMRLQQQFLDAVETLDREVARRATAGAIERIARRFSEHEALTAWFSALALDVTQHFELFLRPKQQIPTADPERARIRYAVNLLVDRHDEPHRPVLVEQNPTYENLFGKIEYRQLPGGGLETDVHLIRAGSLHRANGGVIILRAPDIAAQPALWAYLKAAVRDGEIRIEEFYRAGSPPIAGAPRPVPVPLHVKVVLVGSPVWYNAFFTGDPEFDTYFKIKAHIEPLVDASPDDLGKYAGILAAYAASTGVEVDPAALRLLMGTAARWAGNRRRITASFEKVYTLIDEAKALGNGVVDETAVRRAVAARRRRNAQIEDEVHRAIRDELTIISVTGRAVGQVNGLTVQSVGDHVFGTPARISARASVGRRGVVNIERLVAMSGPIQQKASLVLQGILMRRFARVAPMSFDCSVTFEQLYGGVEGDSASLAEYIAIISDLADLPIRQDIAITGSVNQLGQAQVIGGVHHKIEGFFRACAEQGDLTGEQGVVIPRGNRQHLVVRDDVVEMIEAGLFHVWSVDTVEDAVEIFTGMPVGDGSQPDDDTVYGRVASTLRGFDRMLSERGI